MVPFNNSARSRIPTSPIPIPAGGPVASLAVIFDFEFERFRQKIQPNLRLARTGMAGHVVESLLQHSIDVDRGISIHGKGRTGFQVAYVNPGLLFHGGNVPVQGAFQSGFVEHYRMERLREAAHLIERGLGDVAHFAQIGAQRRAFRKMVGGTGEQRANGGENLAELIMKFARDGAQGGFLRRN